MPIMARKKRRMGRPPLETPRRTVVCIRLTDAEVALVDRLASEYGTSRSGYVQAVVMEHVADHDGGADA